jgi:PKD repeat protein
VTASVSLKNAGNIVTCSLNWGDGTVTSCTTKHAYQTTGVRTITATVTNSGGTGKGTASIKVGRAPVTQRLYTSASARRSSPVLLQGRTVTGGAALHVFLGPIAQTTTVARVVYSIDGVAFYTDKAKPFDLAGSAANGSAFGFESNLLSLGTHTISAKVIYAGGAWGVTSSTFTVASTTPHRLVYSTKASRVTPKALAGATFTGSVAIFLGAKSDAITDAVRVDFYLDGHLRRSDTTAPYDFVGGTATTATMFNTIPVPNGTHVVKAVVVLRSGAIRTYSATVHIV